MKERYTPAGSDSQYVVIDTMTGRPVPLLGGQTPYPTRERAQAEADRLNSVYERAMER